MKGIGVHTPHSFFQEKQDGSKKGWVFGFCSLPPIFSQKCWKSLLYKKNKRLSCGTLVEDIYPYDDGCWASSIDRVLFRWTKPRNYVNFCLMVVEERRMIQLALDSNLTMICIMLVNRLLYLVNTCWVIIL